MSNNAYTNNDILSNQSNNKLITDIMDNFWDNDIWNVNIHNINNNYIQNIIQQINNLKKQLTNKNRVFNINQNYDIEIYDKKYINKEINKLKKDNINYIKIHVECIYDFFIILKKIVKLKNIKNNIFNNIIYINSQLKDNYEYDIENKLEDDIEDDIENKLEDEIENEYNKFIENIDNKEIDTSIINKISITLYNNIIKNNYFINEIRYIKKNNKQVIILDTENLLKSFKIQFFIRKHITQEEYNKYFSIWNYGELNEIAEVLCNISLSEYTNNTKYVEPYSSLSLSFKEKYDLINIFINNYLQNYYVFYTITCKSFDKINNIIMNKNSLCIPIIYEKHDIREQDDHLILFLNYCLKESIIISSDKFKWYKDNHKKIEVKNFKFEYDIDNFKINLILDRYHTNDIIKINSNYYTIPLNNFPIISNLNDISTNNITKSSKLNFDDIMNILIIIYSRILENTSNNLIITNNSHILIIIINQIIKKMSNINKNVEIIFKFLEKNTKKDIFNYLLNGINDSIFNDVELLKDSINNYKNICDIYIILKSIIISYDDLNDNLNDNIIIKDMTKLYNYIISLYDKINDNVYKIRKLSNKKSDVNILFLELNCIYIYIKKISLCKKNI